MFCFIFENQIGQLIRHTLHCHEITKTAKVQRKILSSGALVARRLFCKGEEMASTRSYPLEVTYFRFTCRNDVFKSPFFIKALSRKKKIGKYHFIHLYSTKQSTMSM